LLRADHEAAVDPRHHLPALVRHHLARHDEYHRPGASGLFVDLVKHVPRVDDVADTDRSTELDVLARIETAPERPLRDIGVKETVAPEADAESRRRDGVGSEVGRMGLAERRGVLANLLRRDGGRG